MKKDWEEEYPYLSELLSGLFAWAVVMVIIYIACTLAGSFVAMEWRWASDSPFGRLVLAAFGFWVASDIKFIPSQEERVAIRRRRADREFAETVKKAYAEKEKEKEAKHEQ